MTLQHLRQSQTKQPVSAEAQAALVAKHPCFSKEGHRYARMHLPVAPACNIQCNYCNRKFDCSNETRPGVVSKLLSPAMAARRFEKVKQHVPETQVVGIAGPGDPLANPKATLASLKAISKIDEDVHLCVSTNGLALVDQLDALLAAGVKHLTITINCIDADIGQKIYPWVYFNQQRLRGRKAAQTLIDRQLLGLEAAINAGMLVKVNTVLIPGINDFHIDSLAKELGRFGAFIHNIMPLISDPAHGTYFGLMGQREPSKQELDLARQSAGQSMAQMTHCQQCRADAVGKLGQDIDLAAIEQGSAVANSTLRVAVATSSNQLIDQHFGHATQFLSYLVSAESIEQQQSVDWQQYCSGSDQCADDKQQDLNQLSQFNTVLCSRIGHTPLQELSDLGVEVNTKYALRDIKEALLEIQQSLINQVKPAKRTVCNAGECS
ncbi:MULTISPECIES: nitrogenase cofactor biosynthesis protein NifB [unclassified Agarivorans]|uniref:nitrogenase cofactor biosynthesis protein NifB n=1 Tax=unclassified Agarivorans TaxID=2636026 RepID=UPI0026E2808B|nr:MULTISPECIES: nitrogenase cofactor biosynthesis protein NifB [unclassified Agarivorans]MDO6685937.1 nitrogenase cofactor biosynthesis protein NifB [Agarivorans sp. 3_MG-2023]MDO6713925.1 nitrogenase cofactor biosynthesis protein NifB [Agarivorans sp. 2_MG-2023]MDO6762257.1 nitrogenase cofactor biosynthesis protein NifB [Agarivorans sp. 1_MG-2023]